MKTEHGYALVNLVIAAIAAFCVTLFIQLKEEDINWFIYALAVAPSIWIACFWLTKVKVNEEGVQIGYLLPFRKPLTFKHEDIESYAAVKAGPNKDRAIVGFLQPRGRDKAIMLSGKGTKDFQSLSDFLESIYTEASTKQQ